MLLVAVGHHHSQALDHERLLVLWVIEQQQAVVAASRWAATLLVRTATITPYDTQYAAKQRVHIMAPKPVNEQNQRPRCGRRIGSSKKSSTYQRCSADARSRWCCRPNSPVSVRGGSVARLLSLSESHPARLETSTPESAGLSITPVTTAMRRDHSMHTCEADRGLRLHDHYRRAHMPLSQLSNRLLCICHSRPSWVRLTG